MQTDEALWSRVLADDGEAFREIFHRHGDRVLTQCARWMGTRQDADTVTNDVFVQAWQSRARAHFVDGSLLPWLLVVANNLARRHARSSTRRERLHLRLVTSSSEEVPDIADDIADRDERRQHARALAAALRALPDNDQDVVALCDLGGLQYREAAEVMGVPIGTIRSRLSRARARLQAALDEELPAARAGLLSQSAAASQPDSKETS